MAEQKLNGADVSSGLQQVDSEGVPEGMRSYGFADSGTSAGLLAGQFDGTSVDRLVGYIAFTHSSDPEHGAASQGIRKSARSPQGRPPCRRRPCSSYTYRTTRRRSLAQ